MDRSFVYPGQVPLDTDMLFPQVAAMTAIGNLAQAVFGTSPIAWGLTVTQTATPSLALQIAPGTMTALSTVDGVAYGSLGTNSNPLLKLGINATTITTAAVTAPTGAAGSSAAYLVQAAVTDTDSVPVLLPYLNSAAPSYPFGGPGNNGVSQPTRRLCSIVATIKQGATVASGSTPVVPTADAGNTALAYFTLVVGATAITNSLLTSIIPLVPTPLQFVSTGRLLAVQEFPSGTFTYVPTPGTMKSRVRIVGAGGASGSAAATGSGQVAITGGAGAAAYVEALIPMGGVASVPVTVAMGTVAATGGAAGATGASSSFGTYIIAPGGLGSAAGAAVSTSGIFAGPGAGLSAAATVSGAGVQTIVNRQGEGGSFGYAAGSTGLIAGGGGSSPMGSGGANSSGAGNPGQGYGAGGSGCGNLASASVAQVSGGGSPGFCIVEDYA